MHTALGLILLAGAAFWESKAPAEWSDGELEEMFTGSPWAKNLPPPVPTGGVPSLQVHLATAKPMRDAEEEARRRGRLRKPANEAADDEFREFLRENEGSYVVLAVALPGGIGALDPAEIRRMEEGCYLKVGKKRHKITGHFPPTASDPFLRLVFPRVVPPSEGAIVFELYLPAVPSPYRTVEFFTRNLLYRGKPEL
jgi:hypothetical protein